MNLNKCFILGRMTHEPELRETNSGQKVLNIQIATNDFWTDKKTGEKRERTEFHRIVVWGRQAEVAASYTRKGDLIFVEGRLESREDNAKIRHTDVIASFIQFSSGQNRAREADEEVGYISL